MPPSEGVGRNEWIGGIRGTGVRSTRDPQNKPNATGAVESATPRTPVKSRPWRDGHLPSLRNRRAGSGQRRRAKAVLTKNAATGAGTPAGPAPTPPHRRGGASYNEGEAVYIRRRRRELEQGTEMTRVWQLPLPKIYTELSDAELRLRIEA